MTTTTESTLSISRAARVGADLLDAATEAGLPCTLSMTARIDFSLNAGHNESLTVQFYDDTFADVRTWAAWLGVDAVETVSDHDEAVTFCNAHATVNGVRVRLTGNRRAE